MILTFIVYLSILHLETLYSHILYITVEYLLRGVERENGGGGGINNRRWMKCKLTRPLNRERIQWGKAVYSPFSHFFTSPLLILSLSDFLLDKQRGRGETSAPRTTTPILTSLITFLIPYFFSFPGFFLFSFIFLCLQGEELLCLNNYDIKFLLFFNTVMFHFILYFISI